jgi:hypothetical protein
MRETVIAKGPRAAGARGPFDQPRCHDTTIRPIGLADDRSRVLATSVDRVVGTTWSGWLSTNRPEDVVAVVESTAAAGGADR